jgi:hypothetical protein
MSIMTDNRYSINDLDLVRPEQLLDQGIPLPLLSGKYEVKEGFCAVITEGGVYKETLAPGFYYLYKYKMFRNIRAVVVDMRIKQLTISTNRKYQIKFPVPIQLDLDLVVEYKVRDARMVALEIDQPLHALFDRVNMVINPIVSVATYDEVNLRREDFAARVLQGLKGMQLQKTIGIEVLNVIITNLKALDSGEDALSQQSMDEFQTFRNWQLDSAILQNSQMDIRTMLLQASPDERIKIIRDLIDKGYMDPAGGFLVQPSSKSNANPSQIFNNLLAGNNFSSPQQARLESTYGFQNNNNLSTQNNQGQYTQSRMNEEINLLKTLPGAHVDVKSGTDSNGLFNGSYIVRVDMPKSSGGTIVCVFSCGPNFPDTPPRYAVEVDGEDTPFESSNVRGWRKQYLFEIVREVIASVG